MRLGIGIHGVSAPEGIGSVQRTLLKGFAHLEDRYEIILFGTQTDRQAVSDLPPYTFRTIETQGFRAAVESEKLDLFHGLSYGIPLTRNCKTVVTIHDTLLLENIDHKPEHLVMQMKKIIYACSRWSDRIITVSQHARERIASQLRITSEKIDVVYNGISTEFTHLSNLDKAYSDITRLGITRPYILYVGGVVPRKNLKTLIDAYNLLRQEYNEMITLVIVNGLNGNELAESLEQIFYNYPGIRPNRWNGHTYQSSCVNVTGPLTINELISLYNLAAVFVYPSLAEGFGLPPIEAMACGVPVVASNCTSLPEILGDAALFANALDSNQFAKAILRLLSDQTLASTMRARGYNRAKLYSEHKMALDTLDIYKGLCQ